MLAVFSFQLSLEDGVERIARTIKKPAVLLCDRGTLDGSAYMEKAMWEALLKVRSRAEGWGWESCRCQMLFSLRCG